MGRNDIRVDVDRLIDFYERNKQKAPAEIKVNLGPQACRRVFNTPEDVSRVTHRGYVIVPLGKDRSR
jgi:hypothetical protein